MATRYQMMQQRLIRADQARYGAPASALSNQIVRSFTGQANNPGLSINPGPNRVMVGMTNGIPVYKEVDAAPAPSGGGGGGGGGGAPSGPSPRELQITKEAEAYRKATEEKLALADQTIAKLSDEQEQRRLAAELQNRLQIQAQASARRGQQQAQLQITGGTQTAQTAGTQAFKRRRDQMRLAPIQSTAGINAPASSVLNV